MKALQNSLRLSLALVLGVSPAVQAAQKSVSAAPVVHATPVVGGSLQLSGLNQLSFDLPNVNVQTSIPNTGVVNVAPSGVMPTAGQGAAIEAQKLLPTAHKGAYVAPVLPEINVGAVAPTAQSPVEKLSASAPGAHNGGEFSNLGKLNEGELSGKVWNHAEKRGFERPGESDDVTAGNGGENESGLTPAGASAGSSDNTPPTPPAPKAPTVFSRGVLGFFSSFALIQVAVESLGLAVPQMSDPLTQGFIMLGLLSAISYGAYAVGSLLGGRWVEKFGIKKTYRAVLVARTIIWSAAAFMFDASAQTVPIVPLMALFSLDYFAHSIGRVAEHTLQAAWFKGAPVASSRFGTARDFVEYSTVFAMLGTGLVISTFGFGAVVYATPIMFGLAMIISMFLKSLPDASAKAEKIKLLEGFKGLFGDKSMLKLFFGQTLINNFFYLLYYITATAFSVFVANGDKGLAAEAASSLTGVYGIGALLGTLVMTWITNRMEKKTKLLPEDQRADAETGLLMASGARWLKWSALALMGAWTFMSLTPIGSMIWPIYWVSPALLLIGLTAQIALNHLDPVMKGRMPSDKKASIIGAARALTNLSYAVSFILWGVIFQWLGTGGFIAMGIYSTLIAAAYLWLARSLKQKK